MDSLHVAEGDARVRNGGGLPAGLGSPADDGFAGHWPRERPDSSGGEGPTGAAAVTAAALRQSPLRGRRDLLRE
jgi:hypothetical protein